MINKKKIYLLLSLLILTFSSIIYNVKINTNREIIHTPDDAYHYLSKSNNFNHCVKSECYEDNLFKFKTEKNLERNQEYLVERQIHRLIISYHPLYTFVLSKLTDVKNSFEFQKKITILISLFSAAIIFFILNKFFNPQILLLLSIIIGSHYYSVQAGLNYIVPYSFAALICMCSIFFIKENKILSFILFVISVLIHKIHLVTFAIIFFSYLVISLNKNFNIKKMKEILIREKNLILLTFLTSLFIYNYEYSALETKVTFSSKIRLIELPVLIKDSILFFFTKSIKTFVLLNPILVYFFLKSFFVKLSDQLRLLRLTIILSILTSFFFINFGSVNDYMAKIWIIFILTYIIISFHIMFNYRTNKIEKLLKSIFLITLPFFICLNIYKNMQYYDLRIKKQNFYYNYQNIKDTFNKLELINDDFVYFNSSEATFYYYLNVGFIKKNFLYEKSFPKKESLEKVKYIISNNPLLKNNRNSDLILNNNSIIKILSNDTKNYRIIIYSKNEDEVKINDKKYKLKKGYNELEFNVNQLKFNNIKTIARLFGILIDNNQSTNWPWFQDFEFEYRYGDERKIKYDINYQYVRKYNFKTITNEIFNKFQDCKKSILYDKDSSIITKLECN